MQKRQKDFFKHYDYSKLEKTTPLCKHFGICGGCSFQNISYNSQLKLKKDFLNKVFERDIEINPSKNIFGYRNRMDFVYAFDKLGLRKKDDFRTVIEIESCDLMPEFVKKIYSLIKEKLMRYEIESYDFLQNKGFLRYVVFRYSLETKQIMLIFTSTTPSQEQKNKMTSFFEDIKNLITSIYWFNYDEITDVTVPNILPTSIIGQKNILEKIGDKTYLISPWSFFQINTTVAKELFDKIRVNVEGNAVDLCCGVGAITIYVADKTKSIMGIEQISQAIELANENKKLNHISNILFFTEEMKNLLSIAPLEIDTLIIDPPRAGLEKKVCERIIKANPKKIIYMSCNPKTQKIDLDYLKANYKIISMFAWDMFPQTPHIETLVLLERIEVLN